MFVTLEGIEGTGKSTQADMLYDWITYNGPDVLLTHEPGGTPLAEKIREILKTTPDLSHKQQFMLFHTARIDHIKKCIVPAREAGFTVICDRYMDSTFVYQNDIMDFDGWNDYYDTIFDLGGMPDVTFLLDMDPKEAKARMASRGNKADHWDNESLFEMLKKRALFREAKELISNRRFYEIDASRPQEDITREMYEILKGIR